MACRAGAIVGWRAWRVAETRHGLRLRSAVYDDEWEPGRELEASCPHHAHAAPAADCVCGLYAARDPREAARYLVGRDDAEIVHRVVGLVTLTGAVIEHERGWRAERALPARLWVPAADTDGQAAPAAAVVAALEPYRVLVELVPTFAPRTVAAAVEEAFRDRHTGVSHTRAFPRYARA